METPAENSPVRAAAAALGAVCVLGVFHALYYLFVQDDAYIFFRYAEHWAAGFGPVWNVGERVEGYTSPSWLGILTALRIAAGAFEPGVHVLTVGLAVGSLVLVFLLTKEMTASRWAGVAAALLIASDRTFALWSTSGMETRLFGFLVLLAIFEAGRLRRPEASPREALAFGPVLMCLCLTRPEGFLVSGILLLFVLVTRPRLSPNQWLIGGLIAGATGVSTHLIWRLWYYGDLLPNTFYAKVSGSDWAAGGAFFRDFAASFPVLAWAAVPALLFHLFSAVVLRKPTLESALSIVVVAYVTYLAAIGGGFMEFRLLDPVLAPAAVLAVTAGRTTLRWAVPRHAGRVGAALILTAAAVGLNESVTFEDAPHTVMTRRQMWEETTRIWIDIGKFLGEIALPGESLATTAAGAIPFFSRMPAVDMLGLNDALIARLPVNSSNSVGHRKFAPDSYLEERGVTFIIGFPRLTTHAETLRLQPGEFLMEITSADFDPFYMVVGTTGDRERLIDSLRGRGVTVID